MNENDLDRHIHLIYETVADPARWHDFLDDVIRTINAKSGMIGFDDLATKTNVASLRVGFSNDMLEAFAPFKDKDLWTHRLIERNSPAFLTSHELLPQKEYLCSEVFEGFSRYTDIYHTVGVHLEKEANHALRVGFQRGKNQGFYEREDKDYLNKLLPHIKRAVQLSKQLFENNTCKQLSHQVLEHFGHAVLIVDTSRKVIFKNSVASSYLSKNTLLKVTNEELRSIEGIAGCDLKAAISSVCRKENLADLNNTVPFIVKTRVQNANHIFLVEITRYQQHAESDFEQFFNIRQDILAIVSIKELSRRDISLPQRLRTLFQLSSTEADIATLLARGFSPRDIAEKRCRSIETVRTQIKHVICKVDVKTTTELVALVNKLSF